MEIPPSSSPVTNQSAPAVTNSRFSKLMHFGERAFLFVLIILLVIIGFFCIFARFSAWDDEGYVLLSLRSFHLGGILYKEVYSQYGPAFFLSREFLFKVLHVPVTHDAGRLLTLFHWIVSVCLAGLIVLRITQSRVLGAIASVLTFTVLFNLSNEPNHPQDLCILLLLICGFLSTFTNTEKGRIWFGCAFGVCCGLESLIKLNIGIFMIIGGGIAWLKFSKTFPLKRELMVAVSFVAVVLPIILMRSKLGEVDFLLTCLLLFMTIFAVIFRVLRHKDEQLFALNHTAMTIAAFVVTFLLLCGAIIYHGTTPYWLLFGVLKQHIGFDNTFTYSLIENKMKVLKRLLIIFALTGSVFTFVIDFFRKYKNSGWGNGKQKFINVVKLILFLLCLIFSFLQANNIYFENAFMFPLSTFIWMGIEDNTEHRHDGHNGHNGNDGHRWCFPRTWICMVAAMELLWIYPVAGTQVGCALVLPVIIMVVMLADVLRDGNVERLAATRTALANWAKIAALSTLLLFCAYMLRSFRRQYYMGTPLSFKGSQLIRLSPEQVHTLTSLTRILQSSKGTFFTMPGMNSFYLWTDKEPPVLANTTTWMTLFLPEKQQEMVNTLTKTNDLTIVKNPELIKFWLRPPKNISHDPLVRFIDDNFVFDQKFGDYQIGKRASGNSMKRVAYAKQGN